MYPLHAAGQFPMGIVCAVSFLRGTLIKMDGLRCRMKWKVMFLDYEKKKKPHPQTVSDE